MNKYIIELIGTFFLTFVVALTGNPLAIGATLAAMIAMGGYISGGHYNPAVTLGMFMSKKIERKEAIVYMVYQIIGAFLAALLFWGIAHIRFTPTGAEEVNFLIMALLELIFTFALVLVVLHTTNSDSNRNHQYAAIAIGLILMVGVFAIGPITGAALNPAVGLGPFIADIDELVKHGAQTGIYVLNYVLAPFVGGALASLVFRLTQQK